MRVGGAVFLRSRVEKSVNRTPCLLATHRDVEQRSSPGGPWGIEVAWLYCIRGELEGVGGGGGCW